MKLRGLSVLVVVVIVVGSCWPKAIPHLLFAPDGSEAYFNALLKAFLYKNVHHIELGKAPHPIQLFFLYVRHIGGLAIKSQRLVRIQG